MNQERLNYLDLVKGVGIALVVIGHSPGVSENVIIWLVSFHMPLFYVMSGVLFAYKNSVREPFAQYLRKRFCSMMIPYFWFSLINIFVDCVRYFFNPEVVGREVLRIDMLQTISFFGISVLWFLPTLFLGELCLYGLVRKCPVWLMCIAGVAGAWISPAGTWLVETYIFGEGKVFLTWLGYLLTALLRVPPALTFLLAGYAAYFALQRIRLKAVCEVLLGVCCLILNVVIAFVDAGVAVHYLALNNVLYYYLGAFCASFGLIMVCRHIKPFWLLVFLGKNSLIIMLTHLDCRVMRAAILFATGVNRLLPDTVVFWVSLYLALLLGELFMIILINRFGFFLIGRKKPVKMESPKEWYAGIREDMEKEQE